jgi:hypothetical protein
MRSWVGSQRQLTECLNINALVSRVFLRLPGFGFSQVSPHSSSASPLPFGCEQKFTTFSALQTDISLSFTQVTYTQAEDSPKDRGAHRGAGVPGPCTCLANSLTPFSAHESGPDHFPATTGSQSRQVLHG